MSHQLPEGVVTKRPDSCYLWLLDNFQPSGLLSGTIIGAASAACAGYMAAEAVRIHEKESPDNGPVVIGDSPEAIAAQDALTAAIDAHDAAGAIEGPFNGIALQLLLRFLKQQIRDPSVMDTAAAFWAKAL